jgi:WD40 repeat protein
MKFEIIPLHRLTGHKDCLYSSLLSSDQQYLYTAGADGLVARWDLNEPQDATLAAQVSNGIYCMKFLPNSASLLLGSMTGGLHLVDLLQHKELHLYQRSEQPIFDMDWLGDQLFVAHGDGAMSIWEPESLQSLRLLQSVNISTAALRCLLAHPTEQLVATGSSDGAVRLHNHKGELMQTLAAHNSSVFSLLWLAGGKYLLSGSRDAHLAVWETATGKLLDKFPAHLFTINHLLHLPEVGLVASAGRDKTIKLWDDKSLELVKVANYDKFPGMAHSHSVNKLAWKAHKQQLVSVGDDRKVIIWQIAGTQNNN